MYLYSSRLMHPRVFIFCFKPRYFCFWFSLVLLSSPVFAVDVNTETAIEGHVYPAGVIGTIGQLFTFNQTHCFGIFLGYNNSHRQDFGKNDNEEGGGRGASLLYQYYFNNVFLGFRTDYWSMRIDWMNENQAEPKDQMGTTDIGVLQPTVELGYRWSLSEALSLRTSIAGGAEINVVEDGREVGQGAIGLLRVSLAYLWK